MTTPIRALSAACLCMLALTACAAEASPPAPGSPTIPEKSSVTRSSDTPAPSTEQSAPPAPDNPPAAEEATPDAPGLAFTELTSTVSIARDITYTSASTTQGDLDLQLDLYAPAGINRAELSESPAVILIHGGGFLVGSKNNSDLITWATALAENGYVVAAINYRLLLTSPTVSTPALAGYLATADATAALPAQAPKDSLPALRVAIGAAIEDARAAHQWLASVVGTNPTRIALAGESAGAITALHLAYLDESITGLPTPPAAVINLWGALSTPPTGSVLTPNDPPLWTLHGTADAVVPYAAAQYLDDNARAAGIPHTLHPVANAGHGFTATGFFTQGPTPGVSYLDDSLDFLNAETNK